MGKPLMKRLVGLIILLALVIAGISLKFALQHMGQHSSAIHQASLDHTAADSIHSSKVDVITGPSWTGIATNPKAGPFLEGPNVYADFFSWPDEALGKRVTLSGHLVVRHDLPVFIAHPEPGTTAVGGIPVPEGTDLYKASERSVIEDAHWAFAPEKK